MFPAFGYYEKCCSERIFLYTFVCSHMLSLFLCIYLVVEFLCHKVRLCLNFWRTYKLVSKAASSFYYPSIGGSLWIISGYAVSLRTRHHLLKAKTYDLWPRTTQVSLRNLHTHTHTHGSCMFPTSLWYKKIKDTSCFIFSIGLG